jgi:dTDP-4-dehydrorhamnose 3,5-epimerase
MQIDTTPLAGVLVLVPRRFGDARGFFCETWNRRSLEAAGLDLPAFVQDNQSLSASAGTLRGLHFQAPPHAQGKLVRCGRGRIWDVAVDIRRGSPTQGQSFGLELSAANGRQIWIPQGFLHGFLTLEDDCELLYKCTDFYDPASDGAVRWDSAGVDWPEVPGGAPLLSDRDAAAPPLAGFASPFAWDG